MESSRLEVTFDEIPNILEGLNASGSCDSVFGEFNLMPDVVVSDQQKADLMESLFTAYKDDDNPDEVSFYQEFTLSSGSSATIEVVVFRDVE